MASSIVSNSGTMQDINNFKKEMVANADKAGDVIDEGSMEDFASAADEVAQLELGKKPTPDEGSLADAVGHLMAAEKAAEQSMKAQGDSKGAQSTADEFTKLTTTIANKGDQGGGRLDNFLSDARDAARQYENGNGSTDGTDPGYESSDPGVGQDSGSDSDYDSGSDSDYDSGSDSGYGSD